MVEKAAVKVRLKNEKEVIIPCHRHSDAYEILWTLNVEYEKISEGFIRDDDKYLDRYEAFSEAMRCRQIPSSMELTELFSEDLY